jgi:hypothetical protein
MTITELLKSDRRVERAQKPSCERGVCCCVKAIAVAEISDRRVYRKS